MIEDCLFLNEMPEMVRIGDREIAIESDFRVGVAFEQMIQDRELSDNEKVNTALAMYFGDVMFYDRVKAVDALLWFYSCGRKDKAQEKPLNEVKDGKKVFDFAADSKYLYSAFLDQYRVDLIDIDYLHWWRFNAMIAGLKSDCEFVKIVGYRSLDLGSIKNREMRARYARLQALYRLPDGRSKEEKVAFAGSVFGGVMK